MSIYLLLSISPVQLTVLSSCSLHCRMFAAAYSHSLCAHGVFTLQMTPVVVNWHYINTFKCN